MKLNLTKKLACLSGILLLLAGYGFCKTITVPIDLGDHGEVIIHVKVNDCDAVLLLDTGSTISVISPRIVGSLAALPMTRIFEVHTTQVVHYTHGTLTFGNGDMSTIFIVTNINPEQAPAMGVKRLDGLMGMHDLSAFKSFRINFKQRVLELEQ